MLSQLSEALISQIATITVEFTYWFAMYQSSVTSTLSYFDSYENTTPFRAIIEEHNLKNNYNITWIEGRSPQHVHQRELPTKRYVRITYMSIYG
jgi:hypothetical protein